MTALTVRRPGQTTRAYYGSTGRDPRPVLLPPPDCMPGYSAGAVRRSGLRVRSLLAPLAVVPARSGLAVWRVEDGKPFNGSQP